MNRASHQKARIAWRRGQWATVDAFLRGEHRTRTVGPGMEEGYPEGTLPVEAAKSQTSGHVAGALRLDQLEELLK